MSSGIPRCTGSGQASKTDSVPEWLWPIVGLRSIATGLEAIDLPGTAIAMREALDACEDTLATQAAEIERQKARVRDYESACTARDETIRTQDAVIERLRYDAETARLIALNELQCDYNADSGMWLVGPVDGETMTGPTLGEAVRAALASRGQSDPGQDTVGALEELRTAQSRASRGQGEVPPVVKLIREQGEGNDGERR